MPFKSVASLEEKNLKKSVVSVPLNFPKYPNQTPSQATPQFFKSETGSDFVDGLNHARTSVSPCNACARLDDGWAGGGKRRCAAEERK